MTFLHVTQSERLRINDFQESGWYRGRFRPYAIAA